MWPNPNATVHSRFPPTTARKIVCWVVVVVDGNVLLVFHVAIVDMEHIKWDGEHVWRFQ